MEKHSFTLFHEHQLFISITLALFFLLSLSLFLFSRFCLNGWLMLMISIFNYRAFKLEYTRFANRLHVSIVLLFYSIFLALYFYFSLLMCFWRRKSDIFGREWVITFGPIKNDFFL